MTWHARSCNKVNQIGGAGVHGNQILPFHL
jgi:hypothetical protein